MIFSDERITQLLAHGDSEPIDGHFAQLLQRINKNEDSEVLLASILLGIKLRQGDICFNFNKQQSYFDLFSGEEQTPRAIQIDHILTSSFVSTGNETKPLFLDPQGRLYFSRQRRFLERTAAGIRLRFSRFQPNLCEKTIHRTLQQLFSDGQPLWQNDQAIAAALAARNNFMVITGGPGTGKTTTITRILALLLTLNPNLKIHLAAPTGKAATRLRDSIIEAKNTLDCPAAIKAAIPEETSTLHRLLGLTHTGRQARFNTTNPLPTDLVCVDEASMVDLALLTRLFDALPNQARLILMGDGDQLPSVEAGGILEELCSEPWRSSFSESAISYLQKTTGGKPTCSTSSSPFADCVIHLRKTWRFASNSGIAAFSQAIRLGRSEEALTILQEKNRDLTFKNITFPKALQKELQSPALSKQFFPSNTQTLEQHLENLQNYRILCAMRRGPSGIETVNQQIEKTLLKRGIIKNQFTNYSGKPIMITSNNYSLNLFNGDMGIVYKNKDNSTQVFFQDGNLHRGIPIFRIPMMETVYAMTVHKSQGSEFKHLLLLLPLIDSPLLSRELLYTAVTRTKKQLTIMATPEIIKLAIERRKERETGIMDLLHCEE
jgi:exodeoxyribonuclease V alpha subunit